MIDPRFKVKEEKKEKDYGVFIIEPLEPGFGHTLGVALRRVLLTSIEGAAVTSINIDGVRHMFSTLPGLKEDTIELILNIKSLRLRLLDSKTEAKMTLSVTGSKKVTAHDIELSEGVEIVNPEHYLCSLADKKSKLNIEMTVERGTGYLLAEERKISTVGVIPIDAIFSPVRQVNYRIEQTRVGTRTNYDRLILEIWTDGSVDPQDVLNQASRTLVSHFLQIYEPKQEDLGEPIQVTLPVSEAVLKTTIDELDLPTRIYNSLRNAGIETIGQLIATPRRELTSFRNLGSKSIAVIEEILKQKGIHFEV